MARSKNNHREEFAIKFFMSKRDFDTEEEQYRRENPLHIFLPKVCYAPFLLKTCC